jgi:hypothetical protein
MLGTAEFSKVFLFYCLISPVIPSWLMVGKVILSIYFGSGKDGYFCSMLLLFELKSYWKSMF